MLDRFKRIISSTKKEEEVKEEIKSFHQNFESNDYQYLINNSLLKDEYVHLTKIPTTVLNALEISTKDEDKTMWKGILENKNKISKNVTYNINLKVYWVNFNDLNPIQKEFYYYFRGQVLKGNFIQADLSYIYLFIYEGLYYQWSNYPGFVISLLDKIYQHYRQEPSYTKSLDTNVPLWINGLLLENNEPKLAAKYIFDIQKFDMIKNHSLLLCFAEGKEKFSIKKVSSLIEDYNNPLFKRNQKKINDAFVDLLFIYSFLRNKSLFQLFVKQSAKEQMFEKKPFKNANCQRVIENNQGFHLFYDFKKDDIHAVLNDLYKLAYSVLTDELVSLNYFSTKESNLIIAKYNDDKQEKQKEEVKKIVEKNMGKTNIHQYVKEELLNIKKTNKVDYVSINKGLELKLDKNLTYDNFLELFIEYYMLKLDSSFKDESITLTKIPEDIFKNYYESIEVLPKSHFFYQIMKYRTKLIAKVDDSSIQEYKKTLKEGVIYYHLLRPHQTNAYLYFRQELMKANFIENVHFSFVQLFLSEIFHFNITTNPQEIVGLVHAIIKNYRHVKGFNKVKVELLLQCFLSECQLKESEKYKAKIQLETSETDKILMSNFISLDLNTINSITPFKKYITTYNDYTTNKTKVNNLFKELLPFYNQHKNDELKSHFLRNVEEEFKVDNIYKDLMIQRNTPNVFYYEIMYKFDEKEFIIFMNEFYRYIHAYVNGLDYQSTFLTIEDILTLKQYLDSKYKKVKKKTKAELKAEEEQSALEEFKKNMFDFDEKEIEALKELHAIKEEKEEIKKQQKSASIDKAILDKFVSSFVDDALALSEAEKFAKQQKVALNKLISETNKKCQTNISIEDDMLYND